MINADPCQARGIINARTATPVIVAAERVRALCHAALADKDAEPLLWMYAPHYRDFFHRHAGTERFITEFDEGLKLWVSLRDHIESMVFFHEMQEGDRGLVRFLKKVWLPGQVFMDIGANIGVFTLMAAKRVGLAGIVHAFEPVRELFRRLQANLALNEGLNVIAHHVALSDRSGTATIYVPYHNNLGMASLHATSGLAGRETVMLATLDEQVEALGLTRIDIIKIDVEGHELRVLEGGRLSLGRFRPMVTCEISREHLCRAGTSPEEVVAFMAALGYDCFSIDHYGKLFRDSNFVEHGNVLFCPAEGPLPEGVMS